MWKQIGKQHIMDKKKNVKNEQLEKISGGFDDYNYCDVIRSQRITRVGRISKYHPMTKEGVANGVRPGCIKEDHLFIYYELFGLLCAYKVFQCGSALLLHSCTTSSSSSYRSLASSAAAFPSKTKSCFFAIPSI